MIFLFQPRNTDIIDNFKHEIFSLTLKVNTSRYAILFLFLSPKQE